MYKHHPYYPSGLGREGLDQREHWLVNRKKRSVDRFQHHVGCRYCFRGFCSRVTYCEEQNTSVLGSFSRVVLSGELLPTVVVFVFDSVFTQPPPVSALPSGVRWLRVGILRSVPIPVHPCLFLAIIWYQITKVVYETWTSSLSICGICLGFLPRLSSSCN